MKNLEKERIEIASPKTTSEKTVLISFLNTY